MYKQFRFGHEVLWDGLDGDETYADNGKLFDYQRPCSRCGKVRPDCGALGECADPCLGHLPGVTAACCGHGKENGYIHFENGVHIDLLWKGMVKKLCERNGCGETFWVKESELKRGRGKYCNNACAAMASNNLKLATKWLEECCEDIKDKMEKEVEVLLKNDKIALGRKLIEQNQGGGEVFGGVFLDETDPIDPKVLKRRMIIKKYGRCEENGRYVDENGMELE